MANIIYNRFLRLETSRTYGWDSNTTIRALLVGDDSYTPSKNHETVQEAINAGLVELEAEGYSRQTLPNKTIVVDTSQNQIEYHADNLNFGTVESGKTIYGILFYIRVGQEDDEESDIPVLYIDTATSLPLETNGQAILVTFPNTGIMVKRQAVETEV